MPAQQHLTAPVPSTKMPSGIPFIVGNEAAERFSFYGMRAILFVFMTKHLYDSAGNAAFLTETEAREWQAWFIASAYFFPILGALISDIFWGKYRTILYLSLFYCLGHGSLALMDLPPALLQMLFEPKTFLLLGLCLIAIGSGGIKPCVSAHVGDQFGKSNQHLLPKVFGWFYFSINLGAFASYLITPLLLEHVGPVWAFGVPGILMGIATFVFWLGRTRFVHIPPGGIDYFREVTDSNGLIALMKLVPLYAFVAVFWSLFEQSGSAWTGQAAKMDRHFLGIDWLESQIGAFNPLLILAFIPLFNYAIYPSVNRVFKLTPLRKVSIGFFIAITAFSVSALIQEWIDDGKTPNIVWQLLAYVLMTAAEVMVSITCLEFSYTQAPPKMKSSIMALYLASVSAGNVFTAMVNRLTMDEAGNSTLTGANYYWFFTAVMAGASVLFIPVALLYRERTYLQQEEGASSDTGDEEPPSSTYQGLDLHAASSEQTDTDSHSHSPHDPSIEDETNHDRPS